MERRAQMNQVFTIIATLLIAGAIILIGARLMGGTIDTKCDSNFIIFQDDLKLAIKNNNNYGSVTAESFKTPCGADLLCFVNTEVIGDSNDISADIPSELDSEAAFIIKNSVEDNAEVNIFLVSSDETKILDFAPNLILDKTVLCIKPKSGRFSMTMFGKGRQTLINSKDDLEETTSTSAPSSSVNTNPK